MPFFLVNKPAGYTSYDIVDKFKKIFHGEKVGHSGTLDPMATGLLIIAVGRNSTKHLGKLLGMNKVYIANIDFSIFTDTRDLDFHSIKIQYKLIKEKGKTIGIEKNGEFVKAPSLDEIRQKLNSLIPEANLPLTMFSAKKVNGKKLYKLARHGINLNIKQKMKINSYKILNYDFPILKLMLDVGSGTYIRSIGYWLGQQFGLGGTLTMLHRKSIGPFKIK